MNKNLLGGCHCGNIRYQISNEPFDADYCHCSDCQKSTGSIFGVWMDFDEKDVSIIKGEIKEYQSSEKMLRGFCENCGASLSIRHKDYPQYFSLTIATLDDPNLIQPNYHIYCENQVKWLKIEDSCDRYPRSRLK